MCQMNRMLTQTSESKIHSVVSDSLWLHALHSPWYSPCQNTGVSSCSLLQGIFLTQELNACLTHCRRILYHLSHSHQYFKKKKKKLIDIRKKEFSGSYWQILCYSREWTCSKEGGKRVCPFWIPLTELIAFTMSINNGLWKLTLESKL